MRYFMFMLNLLSVCIFRTLQKAKIDQIFTKIGKNVKHAKDVH